MKVHPTQVTSWKNELLQNAAAVFDAEALATGSKERIRELHEKIGQLAVERECCRMRSGTYRDFSTAGSGPASNTRSRTFGASNDDLHW